MTTTTIQTTPASDIQMPTAKGSWARRNLFNSVPSTAITIIGTALIAWTLWKIVYWAFVGSAWGDSAESCQAISGACWSVVNARARIVLFGLYPYEEHWRSALACVFVVLTVAMSCIPILWSLKRLTLVWLAGAAAFYTLMHGGIFGLSVVSTDRWGGLSLTLYIFVAVCLIGMPLSIVLALARRSQLIILSKMAALLINFVRSLPLLAILFSAALIIPFALPDWLQGDKLTRVIVAFSLFFACYQAEIIRTGMQVLPEGQEEAAKALGLKYWQRTRKIVLPQAFRNSLPAMINQFVMTFKDTSVITIVGFFDVLASAQAAFGVAEWAPYYIEVYVFVAFIYFVFIFSLSRYGAYLEKRMRVGHE